MGVAVVVTRLRPWKDLDLYYSGSTIAVDLVRDRQNELLAESERARLAKQAARPRTPNDRSTIRQLTASALISLAERLDESIEQADRSTGRRAKGFS